MGRPHRKDGCRHTSERVEEKGEKTSRMQEKGNEQLRSEDCVRWDMRRSGKMKDGEEEDEIWRGQPIENYAKKRRKSETTIFYLNLTMNISEKRGKAPLVW